MPLRKSLKGQTIYNTAVDVTHGLLPRPQETLSANMFVLVLSRVLHERVRYVATSGGNSGGRSIIELPLAPSGQTAPYKAPACHAIHFGKAIFSVLCFSSLSLSLCLSLSVCLSVSQSVSQSVCLSVCLSVSLSLSL